MIFIPLAENCFKHCDFDTNEEAFVRINLSVDSGMLTFQAVNSRDEGQLQKDRVGGVGLSNIRRRLGLKYGNNYRLEIKEEKQLFRVCLELPLEISEPVKTPAL